MSLAKKAAKQIVSEPLEILKRAKEQILTREWDDGYQKERSEESRRESDSSSRPGYTEKEREEKVKSKDTRMLSALTREIEDIRADKLFSQLQAKVANGEGISLENYRELTLEQKQVLTAQMEAYGLKKSQEQSEKPVETPSSKPGRRLFSFGKKHAEKLQTKVERPMPPSG